ncbi:hypothetical protein PL75_04900 [Neisseria arctica]|uniref:DUF218 domain-containing protein n=1 Tax=Neisseria arctica TaxID=1470200 RepID=A0A0J1C3Z3_9NEIS|nr:hypothetical protein PL75_04900 [Neisseria arctica]
MLLKRFSLKKILLCLLAVPLSAGLLLFAWVVYTDVRQARKPVEVLHHADSAVVLSTLAYPGGKLNPCLVSRVEAGVELLKAGKVERLVMSGGMSRDHVVGAEVMRDLAVRMGVSAEKIKMETRSSTTYENILYSTPLIWEDHSVILVSNGFHLKRSQWLARAQWPGKDIQLYSGSYCYPDFQTYLFDLTREAAAIVKNGLLGRY